MDERKRVNYQDLFNPKPAGEPVNTHIVQLPVEQEPDYEAMKRFAEDPNLRAAAAWRG